MKFKEYLDCKCNLNENLKIATDAYGDLQNTIAFVKNVCKKNK